MTAFQYTVFSWHCVLICGSVLAVGLKMQYPAGSVGVSAG